MDLRFHAVTLAIVATETERGIGGEQAVFHRLRKHAAHSAADVLYALSAQALLPACGNERPAIPPGEVSEWPSTEYGEYVPFEVHVVDAGRAELACLGGVGVEPFSGVGL